MVAVGRRAFVAWQAQVPERPIDVGPQEGTSFFELPGPRVRPVRTRIEPAATAAGALAARVLGGDGAPLPVLLLGDSLRPVPVTSPPLGLAARDDGGAWTLHDGQVVHHDADGGAVRAVALPAVAVLPSVDSGAWAIGQGAAWRIAGDGGVDGPYDWAGGVRSAPAGGGVAAPSKGAAPVLELLDAAGVRVTDVPLEPHEQVLASGDGVLVTRSGGALRRGDDAIPLQSAGLADDETPWVSGRAGPALVELRHGDTVTRLPVPEHGAAGALRVVAVSGDDVLVSALDRAWRLSGGVVVEEIALDDTSYREAVFPVAWELTAVTATPAGTVLVGASGPTGLAVIEL